MCAANSRSCGGVDGAAGRGGAQRLRVAAAAPFVGAVGRAYPGIVFYQQCPLHPPIRNQIPSMRISHKILLGLVGLLLLQGCATVSMQDILRSSDSRLVMPSPSVRVPFRDTALALHFSMSATRIGETSRELRIHSSESGSKPDSVAMADAKSRGISLVRNEPFVAAMEVSAQLPNQFRAGFGLERSRREANYRLEIGKAFGDAWPLEVFVSIGNATVTSRTRWTSIRSECCCSS